MVAATTSGLLDTRRSSARRMVGPSASRCARDAISGTTPPNRACSSTLDATSSASSFTVPSSASRRCRLRFRRRSFRWPGWSVIWDFPLLSTHRVGVGAADPVVTLAQSDVHESDALVQRDRGSVVGPHFQDTRGMPSANASRSSSSRRSDASSLIGRIDADGVNLVLEGRLSRQASRSRRNRPAYRRRARRRSGCAPRRARAGKRPPATGRRPRTAGLEFRAPRRVTAAPARRRCPSSRATSSPWLGVGPA